MFVWSSDSFFAEMRDIEILNERLNIVDRVTPNAGVYFSTAWVMRDILKFTDEEIEQMKKEIEEDKKNGQPMPQDDPTMNPDDYSSQNDEPEDDEDDYGADGYIGTDKEKEEESILYERR